MDAVALRASLIDGIVEVIQRLAIARILARLTSDISYLLPKVGERVTLDVQARKRAAGELRGL